MGINKITINGVDYELTDKQAQLILELLTQRVDELEDSQRELEDKLEWGGDW